MSERFVRVHAHSSFLFSIIFGNVSGPFTCSLRGDCLRLIDNAALPLESIALQISTSPVRSIAVNELIYSPAKC